MIIVKQYADRRLSGTTDDRPEFQKMLLDAERKIFDVLIVWKIDRFARNRYDSAIYKQRLKKAGVRIIYAKEQIPDGPEGVILESVLEGMAEWYSKNLAQNIRRGIRENALHGRAIGAAPYGFTTDKEKNFIIDETTAPVVQEIFTRYAAGEPAVNIYSDLNRRGLQTASKKPFNRSSLHRILSQEKYTGLYKYDDITIPDACPRLVSDDLFKKCQERTVLNKRNSKRVVAPVAVPADVPTDFILTGKAICGCCGGSLVGTSGTGRHGGKFFYYTCHNKRNKKLKCSKGNIKKGLLESIVFDAVNFNVLSNQEVIEEVIAACLRLQAERTKFDPAAAQKAELKELQKSIDNIFKAIEAGILSAGLSERLNSLEERAAELSETIAVLSVPEPTLTRDQLLYIFSKFQSEAEAGFLEKAINTFVNKIIVFDEKIQVFFNLSEHEKIEVDLNKAEQLFSFSGGSPVGASAPLLATRANPSNTQQICVFNGGFAIEVNI